MRAFFSLILICLAAVTMDSRAVRAQKTTLPLSVPAGPAASTAGARTAAPLSTLNPAFAIPGGPAVDNRAVSDDADPMKSPIFLSLMPAMQTQIMNEAQGYSTQCQGRGSYAAKHNCGCLGLHFMNERLRHPDFSESRIDDIVLTDCVDVVSLAGYAYNKCLGLYAGIYPEGIQALCECYSRRFARAYARNPNVTSQYEIDLGADTMGRCRAQQTGASPSGTFAPTTTAPAVAKTSTSADIDAPKR